jgi:hypothetical protein
MRSRGVARAWTGRKDRGGLTFAFGRGRHEGCSGSGSCSRSVRVAASLGDGQEARGRRAVGGCSWPARNCGASTLTTAIGLQWPQAHAVQLRAARQEALRLGERLRAPRKRVRSDLLTSSALVRPLRWEVWIKQAESSADVGCWTTRAQ